MPRVWLAYARGFKTAVPQCGPDLSLPSGSQVPGGYRDPRWRVQNPGDHSLGIQTTGMARETGRLPEYNLKEKCCHERRKHCHFLAGGALLTGPAHPGECTHLRDPYLRPGPGGSLRQPERLFYHPGPEGGGRGERPFISMPDYRTGGGYRDACFPSEREFRQQFRQAVLDAYEQALYQLPQRQQEYQAESTQNSESM